MVELHVSPLWPCSSKTDSERGSPPEGILQWKFFAQLWNDLFIRETGLVMAGLEFQGPPPHSSFFIALLIFLLHSFIVLFNASKRFQNLSNWRTTSCSIIINRGLFSLLPRFESKLVCFFCSPDIPMRLHDINNPSCKGRKRLLSSLSFLSWYEDTWQWTLYNKRCVTQLHIQVLHYPCHLCIYSSH